MGVSAVVVNYNGGTDLSACLRSLTRQAELHEVIVVDNSSSDTSLEEARQAHPDLHFVVRDVNDGFGSAANVGADHATADILVFLNPDVRLDPGCLAYLAACLYDQPGIAGPLLRIEASGTTELGGTVDLLGMPRGLHQPSQNSGLPLYFSGCLLATNRSIFNELGQFDERYFLFLEDVEYCWRVLLAGYHLHACDRSTAWHRGGGSTPGGYAVGASITTTDLRVKLRERNTLAMFIACAPAKWLPILIVGQILKTLGLAVATVLLLRRPALGGAIASGLWWNVRQCRASLVRRRSVPRTRQAEREAFSRIARRIHMLDAVREFGLPRFIDQSSSLTGTAAPGAILGQPPSNAAERLGAPHILDELATAIPRPPSGAPHEKVDGNLDNAYLGSAVSVVIPTLDASSTLDRCLAALRAQTVPPVEVIIVDGGSTDATVEVAASGGCSILHAKGGILIARAVGTRASRGDWVLLLDSDQLLRPLTIEKIATAEADALFLEESAAPGTGLLRRLFEYDRRLVHILKWDDPETGVLMPRAFRQGVILDAIDRIPVAELREVVSEDHLILYKEVSDLTASFATIPDAVQHVERHRLGLVLGHYFRFGRATARARRNPVFMRAYGRLIKSKRRPRPFAIRHPFLSVASLLLTAIKYAPYRMGELLEIAINGRR